MIREYLINFDPSISDRYPNLADTQWTAIPMSDRTPGIKGESFFDLLCQLSVSGIKYSLMFTYPAWSAILELRKQQIGITCPQSKS
jgi:hypothetical protein